MVVSDVSRASSSCFLLAAAVVTACATTSPSPSGSSGALDALGARELRAVSMEAPAAMTLVASDGVSLAFRVFRPSDAPRAVLVFFHGGGAHGAAGYAPFAAALAARGIAVVVPDLRGHGLSGGPRGDAPSAEQVEQDVRTIVADARKRVPGVPLFVGGHSSGTGIVLNSAASLEGVAGLVFVAPELGFRAHTDRDDAPHFATVEVWRFALNAMSFGLLFGHDNAVHFSYDDDVLRADPLIVKGNSVFMANALTPRVPGAQLEALRPPLLAVLASQDALVDKERATAFLAAHAPKATVTVVDATHLGILLHVDAAVAAFIGETLATAR